VGDETATVVFSARNTEQGESPAPPRPPWPLVSHVYPSSCHFLAELLKPGTYVTLTNAKVDMVRSNMRLTVGAAGKIEAADGAAFEPKVRQKRDILSLYTFYYTYYTILHYFYSIFSLTKICRLTSTCRRWNLSWCRCRMRARVPVGRQRQRRRSAGRRRRARRPREEGRRPAEAAG
jgi:hypothetical protein